MDPIPELLYSVFCLCDNALSTACVVWLCWQFPALAQRPWRVLLVAGVLVLGTPLIVSLGHCFSRMRWDAFWMSQLYAWNLLWTATAIPFFILTMVMLRRITGIVVTRPGVTPPSRQAISIRDLFVWTLVVAIFFALTGAVTGSMHDAVSSFGAPFSGIAAVGYAAFHALVYGASVYLLLPNLGSSIWVRALVVYAIYVMSRGMYVVLMSSAGEASAMPADYWLNTTIRGVSATAGMILGHRILMARDYQYWFRPKQTIQAANH